MGPWQVRRSSCRKAASLAHGYSSDAQPVVLLVYEPRSCKPYERLAPTFFCFPYAYNNAVYGAHTLRPFTWTVTTRVNIKHSTFKSLPTLRTAEKGSLPDSRLNFIVVAVYPTHTNVVADRLHRSVGEGDEWRHLIPVQFLLLCPKSPTSSFSSFKITDEPLSS